MVGAPGAPDLEMNRPDMVGIQDVVQLLFRLPGRIGRQIPVVGRTEGKGFHEAVHLARSFEKIEIPADDRRSIPRNDLVEVIQLTAAGTGAQGKVKQEQVDSVDFKFQDQPFHAGRKVMKCTGKAFPFREKRVGLAAENRNLPGQRIRRILDRAMLVLFERGGDLLGLVHIVRAEGPRVDLHQPDHIRVARGDIVDDALQMLPVRAQIPVDGQDVFPHAGGSARPVGNIVDQKSHVRSMEPRSRFPDAGPFQEYTPAFSKWFGQI